MFLIADCQTETIGKLDDQINSVCKQNTTSSIDIPNGVGCFDGTISGSVLSYQCDEGYRLDPFKRNQTCLSDGNWSGETPVCQSLCKLSPCKGDSV